MRKKVEIVVELQNYIDNPPVHPRQMLANAASNDGPTIDHWRETWLSNIRKNKKTYGSFAEHGLGQFWGLYDNRPCIIAGSGPSLKNNIHKLKDRPESVGLVSCLHNFHAMEDSGARVDFYVTLDAGKVTVDEVSEGGKKTPEEYWDLSKGRKLLAFIGTDPELLAKWQGEVYFFNAPIPDRKMQEGLKEIDEVFSTRLGNGGNVLGACLYFAKAICGANPIVFVGADFSFGYDEKFHAWDSKYDGNMGQVVRLTDIFGVKVSSWPSYANFKQWFEYIAATVPGFWINASEGGCLGSYPDGNIRQIIQMPLDFVYEMMTVHRHSRSQCENPAVPSDLMVF